MARVLALIMACVFAVVLGIANQSISAQDEPCNKDCGVLGDEGSGTRAGCGFSEEEVTENSGCKYQCCEESLGSQGTNCGGTYPKCNDNCDYWISCGDYN